MDPQGLAAARYRVVPRTLVFVRCGARVLLTRRPEGAPVWPGRYNGVGGHVEAGEDVFAAAEREVREETGLHVTGLRLGGLLHVTEPGADEGVLLFVLAAESATERIAPDRAAAATWVLAEDAGSLPVVPDVPVLLRRLWGGGEGAVFSARSALGASPTPVFHPLGG